VILLATVEEFVLLLAPVVFDGDVAVLLLMTKPGREGAGLVLASVPGVGEGRACGGLEAAVSVGVGVTTVGGVPVLGAVLSAGGIGLGVTDAVAVLLRAGASRRAAANSPS
jgi:hypothetical protein